ncbi:hypothetical protein AVEN_161022-1 [Araneus ventricosus]|uniref:Uncharacterized protein n=1 Tax=Araneus ventricosus TaxID=182803 RepID=A0A4Y2V854_ARAVE|nr:hypothetical protein AVEN_161022-1 [Araneus ventricosus]
MLLKQLKEGTASESSQLAARVTSVLRTDPKIQHAKQRMRRGPPNKKFSAQFREVLTNEVFLSRVGLSSDSLEHTVSFMDSSRLSSTENGHPSLPSYEFSEKALCAKCH